MERNIRIFDTTLRDGEQTPGVHFTPEVKVAVAERLEAFGVATIEAGFPASSPGEVEAVSQVARRVRACEVAALARCVISDVDAAAKALEPAAQPVIHVFLGTSDIHLGSKLHMERADALRAVERTVSRARGYAEAVQFSAEDATRTERAFLRQCVQVAIASGASRVNIPDTVGCALPEEYGAVIRDIVALAGPGVIVSAHCHNDMGLATANSVAAAQAGAGQLEVAVNGIGERAGNAAAEEVAVVLAMKGIAAAGVSLDRIVSLSAFVSEVSGVPIQPNRAVVGANAFAHSAGIHQDGILKKPENYEFVPPTLVGAPGHRFVMTARSGRSAIMHHARAMGFELSAAQANKAYQAFIRAADAVRGAVPDAELSRIIRETCAV